MSIWRSTSHRKEVKIGSKVIRFEMMSETIRRMQTQPAIAQKFVDAKVAGVVGRLNSV